MADEVENSLMKASQDAAREYDSRLFWLAGGAITVTFALADSIAQSRALVSVAWLVAGICLFVAGLTVTMVGHQLTIRQCNLWFEYLRMKPASPTKDTTEMTTRREKATRLTRWLFPLNYAALAAVLGGIACVSVFVIENLSKGVAR
jgi:hypothetical protein